MAFELPDGKTARTLPEQVKFLTEKVKELILAFNQSGLKKIEVVEELPEVGDPSALYLLVVEDPEEENYYEEYLWIEGAWEMIGTTQIDLSNYVTLDSEQTITGPKKFSTSFYLTDNWLFHEATPGIFYLENVGQNTGLKFERDKLFPETPNYTSLGTSAKKFKNLYLSGVISDGTNSATATEIAALITYAKAQGWIS